MSYPAKIEGQEGSNQEGRPTKYDRSFTDMAYMLCLLGATDQQLADFFKVTISTINLWKDKHPKFSDALCRGKIWADAQIAKALFKLAIGYDYTEVTYEKVDSKEVLDITGDAAIMKNAYRKKVVKKHLPPNMGAIAMWLKNRQRELWRDKQDFGIEFENMTDQQLEIIVQKLISQVK